MKKKKPKITFWGKAAAAAKEEEGNSKAINFALFFKKIQKISLL